MNTVLIIFSVLAFAATSITTRVFQLKCAKNERDTDLFQSLFCLVGAVAYLIRAGFRFDLSLPQGISAALFGLFFAFASLFSAFCYMHGPMSLSSVIVNCSVVFPILYSCITLHESISLPQLIGCALLLITFILSTSHAEDTEKKINLRWLLYIFIAFFSNGVTAVIQKRYKLSAPTADGNAFMGTAYLIAAVVLLISFLLKHRRPAAGDSGASFRFSPLVGLLILCAGLGSFFGNGVLLKLSTVVPASLLYPFINGGLCVTVSVCSLLCFREKLTVKKAAAILIGLASVIVLNL